MPDAIAYISRDTDGLLWKKTLEAALGPIDFRTLDNLGDKADIEVALAWKPPAGLIASFPNVKLIVSLGMGVDHLLADDKLPEGVPITRIMDDGLVGQMSEYAIYWALRHHRDIDKYAASQRAKQWKVEDFVDTLHRRIGILGLGTIGQDTARKFAALGFPDGRLEPHAEDAARHRDLPRCGRPRPVAGAERHPGQRAAAHARHARACSTPGSSRRCPRAPTSSTWRAAAMSWTTTCWPRSTQAILSGAALDVFNTEPLPAGASLLDASQGPGDAAHRRRHQSAHRLARGDREHQAPARPASR